MALVTLTDIAFSIDSIVTAVGIGDGFPAHFGDTGKYLIVLTGGVLGIITMRFVVRYFVLLLDRFPGLAEGAYFLVAWIGLKLVISGLSDAATSLSDGSIKPFHIPEILFWTVMVLIMIVSFLISPKQSAQQTIRHQKSSTCSNPKQNPATRAGTSRDDGQGSRSRLEPGDGGARRPSRIALRANRLSRARLLLR